MADWSQLPEDVLHLISTHLETPTDLLRFRSICTTWRSSASPTHHRFSNPLPILPNDGFSTTTTTSFGFHLSKRSIFLLTNPRNQTPTNQSWLIKTSQNTPHKTHLLNPLSRSRFRFDPLPPTLPPILDLTNFRIRELGHEFVLHHINYHPGNLYMEKVVVLTCDNGFDFLLLTIHVSGKLAVFRSGDKKWTIIQEMPSPYDDVVLYRGRLYAVDNTGRMVVVSFGLGLDLDLVAESVFGGDKKYLVESEGGLLLVDMYLSIEAADEEDDAAENEEEEDEEDEESGGFCVSERTVKFKVYRLDERRGKWEEVRSLGDRVVFLGDDCTFSASATEIGSGRGNCVIFTDNLFYLDGEEGGGEGLEGWSGIGVFDLETGCIGPLGNCPEFCKLIWPPPQWITSITVEVSFVTIWYFCHVNAVLVKLLTLESCNMCTLFALFDFVIVIGLNVSWFKVINGNIL